MRIEDSQAAKKRDLKNVVNKEIFEQVHRQKRKKNWMKAQGMLVGEKPQKCTKCQGWMDGKIARLQLENKREDAPICIPCVIGIKRKPKNETETNI